MAKTGATGITRIINAGKYSIKGLKAAFINEAAFRQDCILSVILFASAFWIVSDAQEAKALYFIALISGPFLVLFAEIINSAIEAVVDRIGDEYHELSGRAKDMGSAAVFLTLTYSAVSWIAVILRVYVGI